MPFSSRLGMPGEVSHGVHCLFEDHTVGILQVVSGQKAWNTSEIEAKTPKTLARAELKLGKLVY